MIQQMQLQKCIGELRALAVSFFIPTGEKGGEMYDKMKPTIEKMIEELENECG